tara:strand:- start:242 stop:1015 length:774 start_codon:yes stop_codon:yes gene_type:complete
MPEDSLNKKIREIKRNGICFLPNQLSSTECSKTIALLEKILKKRIKKNHNIGNIYGRMLISYFHDNPLLLKLINFSDVDLVLKKLIDDHYVLITSNAMDGSYNERYKFSDNPAGMDWHSDSRIVGGNKLDKGFNYLVLVALDNFTVNNGATLYIPKSHLIREPIKRFKTYKKKNILIKKGSVAILDAALYHRRGDISQIRRWSIFSMYGPWFMKPYYNFEKMFGKKFKSIDKKYQKLLHYNSTPPKNHNIRVHTLKY